MDRAWLLPDVRQALESLARCAELDPDGPWRQHYRALLPTFFSALEEARGIYDADRDLRVVSDFDEGRL